MNAKSIGITTSMMRHWTSRTNFLKLKMRSVCVATEICDWLKYGHNPIHRIYLSKKIKLKDRKTRDVQIDYR